jgi:hypothetical protein
LEAIAMEYAKPIHSRFFNIEGDIDIYSGEFILQTAKDVIALNGTIKMTMSPEQNIVYEGRVIHSTVSMNIFHDNEENYEIRTPNGFYGIAVIDRYKISGNIILKGIVVHQLLSSKKEQEIDCSHLYIFNFDETYAGNVNLSVGEWSIYLQKRHDYKEKEIFTKLKNEAGYGITHVVEIKKVNNELYSEKEIEHFIEVLTWLLSLCAGRQVGIGIHTGFRNSSVIFENFMSPIISPFEIKSNWIPRQDPTALPSLFSLLVCKFKDDFTGKVIKETISWYIEVMKYSFIEKKMILIQVALEMLSWVLLTQVSSAEMTEKEFNSLKTASAKIRKMLEKMNVATKIPNSLSHLQIDGQFEDGPHLFTHYRNKITHPTKKSIYDSISVTEKWEIVNLGIYYLELTLLYLIGYGGYYTNHLQFPSWEGEYERVPWCSSQTSE